MALKFRRGTTAQKSGSLAFGEPYVNTTLGTLQIGGPDGDITLGSTGTGSTGVFGAISGSGLDITGNANIAGNLTLGGQLTIGDNTSDTVNVVASLSSSLIPSITNTFDLGSANYFWRDLYISTGSIKFVGAAGVVVGTLSNTSNGLNLDGGIVTNGDSSFGTSSVSVTSVTGSLRVSGSVSVIGEVSSSGLIRANNGIFIPNSVQVTGIGGLGIGAYGDTLMLGTSGSGGAGQQSLIFTPNATNSYTFPNGSGTLAFTSDLNSSNTSISNLNSFTSSINTTIKSKLDADGVISGSSQITLSSTTGGGTSANVQFGSLGIGMAASGVSGEIKASADIIAFASSDNRLKENIKPIENALDKVSKISGNTYDWKVGFEEIHSHTGEDVGVIAQEIEAVLPQLVTTREHGYKAVQYEKLTALLIEAIKEQQTQIHNLTLEVEKLKEQKGL